MEQELYLSQSNLDKMKEIIQIELLKRGITAPIIKFEEEIYKSSHYIRFNTEPFQTIPVIFKNILVDNFSTSVLKKPKSELREGVEGEYIHVWISVHFSWESFGGGTNGIKIFDIVFNVFGDTEYDVYLKEIR